MNHSFWQGKKVLITGHTGFKGAWLSLWLHKLGAKIFGIGLEPNTTPNLYTLAEIDNLCDGYFQDIRDASAVAELIHNIQPEILFHMAAQPLVVASYNDPIDTFSTNIMGTAHILDAIRGQDCVRVAVIITTDKVYQNNSEFWPYRENDTLGGHDPYSASKAACEIVIASYRDAFLSSQGVAVASARAGNVIGGGDWAANRLIPDAVRAWQSGNPLLIRNPAAIRPWQHVLEPLSGYLILAKKLWEEPTLSGPYNFGPESTQLATVHDTIELARKYFSGPTEVLYDTESNPLKESVRLTLDISKSFYQLGIQSHWFLSDAIKYTMDWYSSQMAGKDMRVVCEDQITIFEGFFDEF